jgi:hypothetical protein
MIDVLGELARNSADNRVNTQVLIGSPGIGKSILFFLHALWLTLDSETKVMYWRKASEDETSIILLCMEASQKGAAGNQSVRILCRDNIPFERNINDIYMYWMQRAFPELFDGEDLEEMPLLEGFVTELLRAKTVTMFADGPKHTDTNDTKTGGIHFLCSSSGHPLPANDQNTSKIVSLLCGWKQHDLILCLKNYSTKEMGERLWNEQIALNDDSADEDSVQFDGDEQAGENEVYTLAQKIDDVVDHVYYFTGGRVRDALKLLRGRITLAKFQSDAVSLVGTLPTGAVDLSIHGKYGTKSAKSFDRLRTYFELERTDPAEYIQIVDSGYTLSILGDRDMGDKYLEAYKEAIKLGEMHMAGHHFEKMMHQVFIRLAVSGNAELPFDGHTQATGKTIEGVRQLTKEKYWIPSVPNFPGIDSAVVTASGDVLGIQYFAGKRHGFKARAFKNAFLNHLPVGDTDSCHIVYVVPSDQQGRPTDVITFPSCVVQVDVTSMTTVMQSAINVFRISDN